MKITASIVIFDNKTSEVIRAINSVLNSTLNVELYVIDNSENTIFEKILKNYKVQYIRNSVNIGFGRGHNAVLEKALNEFNTDYHIVINPDVYFDPTTIETMFKYMEKNKDIGLLAPKVLYPDGSLQYLCKLLPNPWILFFRRFFLISKTLSKVSFVHEYNNYYQLREVDYDQIMEIPSLSGCFMFLRGSALEDVGLFDRKIFMYMEDIDLCRRINVKYKTVHYPQAIIYHEFGKGSYKKLSLFLSHIRSAIYYFNKWGWFFDKYRKQVNRVTVDRYIHKIGETQTSPPKRKAKEKKVKA